MPGATIVQLEMLESILYRLPSLLLVVLGLSNAMSDMHVEAPAGNTFGGVHQDYLFVFQQWFSVVNAKGQTQLKITKSMGNFFSPEVDFKVYTA